MERFKNCNHSKHRTKEDKIKIIKRLNVVEGQINGIKQMISDDRFCDDILIQISAVSKSLKSIGNSMLRSHIETCLADDIKNSNCDAIDDIINLFGRIN